MRIPSKVNIMGKTYAVRVIPVKQWADESAVAFYDAGKYEIHIKDNDPQLKVHSFFHEWLHAAMEAMGENELYSNEKFIDVLGGLLLQLQGDIEKCQQRNKPVPKRDAASRTSRKSMTMTTSSHAKSRRRSKN